MEKKKQVLSCIQPTGDCVYGVVDYHAMTMPYDPKKLRTNTWELIFNLLAVGIKEENLFIQSLIPEHSELCWIFNCFTSYGMLTRMTYTEVPKVMSPAAPDRKMSKSLGEKHYINVFGEEARIRKQIKSAVTDTGETKEGEMSAGIVNLFTLLKACDKKEAHDALMQDYQSGGLKYVDLKQAVADALVEKTTIFRARKAELQSNKKEIKNKIKHASYEIRKQAQATLKEVKDLTGLMNVRF